MLDAAQPKKSQGDAVAPKNELHVPLDWSRLGPYSCCMEKELSIRLAAEAARHHGIITRAQAGDLGASRSLIDRRVRSGAWQRISPGVFAVSGTPATWERAVTAAVYGTGPLALASHATACHLHGLTRRPRRIEVTVPGVARPNREYVIHRSTDLEESDYVTVVGIPTTCVARTMVDVGVPWGEVWASRALDEAVRRNLTTLRQVAAMLHRVARKGRRGAGVMRSVLEDRLGWTNLTESQLEAEFLRILVAAGIPLPDSQVRVTKRGGTFIARVDFIYRDASLVIELDGERYHTDRDTFRGDRRRQNDLVQEGLRVLRFTAWDLFAAPEYVVSQVAAALALR